MNLPAGLIDHNYEFFTHEGVHAYCLTRGQVIAFEDWPAELLASIETQMIRQPKKLHGLLMMGILDRNELIKQFIICNYGGFDHRADMIDGKLQETEYWPCPQREVCSFNGIVCDGCKTDTGEFLSHQELNVVKLTAKGHLDKEIADHLNISLHTVTTHTRNIRRKTGLLRKSDITRFAHQKQLVS